MLADTAPEIEKMWHDLWLKKTPQERTRFASAMFVSARNTIISTLPDDLSEVEFKKQLFERIYGFPLPAEAIEKLNRYAQIS